MERLSNIMRGSQGPHQVARQRLQQQPSAQGQRQPLPGQRPLPEQAGRLNAANRVPGPYSSRPALPRRVPGAQNETWEESMQPPMHPLNRANYSSQRPQRVPSPARYIEPPQGDYYEEDERSTIVPADVQDEWSDDTAGMRYGDWERAPGLNYATDYEDEEEYAPPVARLHDTHPTTRPPAQEMSQVAQRLAQLHGKRDPLATRELYRAGTENPRNTTRELYRAGTENPRVNPITREGRLPVPAANPQSVPAQRVPQRTTQPLKPQQVARLHNEMQQRALRPQLPDAPPVTGADYTITVNSTTTTGVCAICKGAGFLRNNVPFGHPQFGKAVACQCKEQERKRKRRQQLQEISNLGAFANKRFNTFNPRIQGLQEAFQNSMEFAKAPDGWLLLVGPNGCGKTHLAAAIANDCLEAGAVVLFATVPDLLDHLRAAFAPESKEVFDQLFARMREAELLILDDLGTQQSSPWANEKLFQLLNYRYNSGFPTVITANPKGLQTTDERIRSRLSDISLVTMLNLERARDYRPNNPHRS